MAKHYEVIVGNIGTIYSGRSEREALRRYRLYVEQSEHTTGCRASGESVVLMTNGVLTREHLGSIAIEDDDDDDDQTFGL